MKENWSMLSINREISARHRAIFNLLEANFLSFIPKFNCLSWGSTIDWYWIRWIIDHKSLVIALSFLAWLPFHTHTRSQRMNSLLSYCIRESRALSIVWDILPHLEVETSSSGTHTSNSGPSTASSIEECAICGSRTCLLYTSPSPRD